MTFEATMHVDENEVATIRLAGDLDSRSAPQLNELVVEAARRPVNRLVLLMHRLTYMSSAGLRCLLFAHQRMPRGVEIVLIGTQPQVLETIRLTGFDQSVVMQESADA